MWSVADTARALATAIYAFHTRRSGDVGGTSFTKDDDLSVTIVAAASNLRCHCYGIPRLSEFDAKGKAGNIIHAIATTNAIISGYIVLEAIKLLSGCRGALRSSFLTGVRRPRHAVPAHRLDAVEVKQRQDARAGGARRVQQALHGAYHSGESPVQAVFNAYGGLCNVHVTAAETPCRRCPTRTASSPSQRRCRRPTRRASCAALQSRTSHSTP